MQSKITLIGLNDYLYDPDTNPLGLFRTLSVPSDTLDLDTLITTILMRGGNYEVLYPNPYLMQPLIEAWSVKWADTIQRWYNAFTARYDPISNYDRHEEWTDESKGNGKGTSKGTNENTRSAYDVNDSDGYSPVEKDVSDGTSSNEFENNAKHIGHLYGNIGVTTNQQMIEAEFNLFKINLYNEVADLFLKEFVIPVR